jgi:hypothetical protein
MPSIKPSLKMTTNLAGLRKLARISKPNFIKAMEKAAIQFLTWCNNGSPREPRKPPIRWGILRGSSSAFVGKKLVSIFQINTSGAIEAPTPAQSHAADATTATWVWNTDYATRMHEWRGSWGRFTLQDGNAGNKWLEKHLRKDRNALMELVATEFRKETGT